LKVGVIVIAKADPPTVNANANLAIHRSLAILFPP
jgi:hypothetical protein